MGTGIEIGRRRGREQGKGRVGVAEGKGKREGSVWGKEEGDGEKESGKGKRE